MRIPLEHFTQAPVITLEPPAMSRRVGSAPNSPMNARRATLGTHNFLQHSMQMMTSSLTSISGNELDEDEEDAGISTFSRRDGGRRSFYFTNSSGSGSLPPADHTTTSNQENKASSKSRMSYFSRYEMPKICFNHCA